MSTPRVSAHDYRLSLQFWVKHLFHRNEEGIQIDMEDTASHETIYKLAQRADKASFASQGDPAFLGFVKSQAYKHPQNVINLLHISLRFYDYYIPLIIKSSAEVMRWKNQT